MDIAVLLQKLEEIQRAICTENSETLHRMVDDVEEMVLRAQRETPEQVRRMSRHVAI